MENIKDIDLIVEIEKRGFVVCKSNAIAYKYVTAITHVVFTPAKKDWADSGSGLWEETLLFERIKQ